MICKLKYIIISALVIASASQTVQLLTNPAKVGERVSHADGAGLILSKSGGHARVAYDSGTKRGKTSWVSTKELQLVADAPQTVRHSTTGLGILKWDRSYTNFNPFYADGKQVMRWYKGKQKWLTSSMSQDNFDKLPEATQTQLRDDTGTPGLSYDQCEEQPSATAPFSALIEDVKEASQKRDGQDTTDYIYSRDLDVAAHEDQNANGAAAGPVMQNPPATLKEAGRKEHKIDMDGNCLFNSFCYNYEQLDGSTGTCQHDTLRTMVFQQLREMKNAAHIDQEDDDDTIIPKAYLQSLDDDNLNALENGSADAGRQNGVWNKAETDFAMIVLSKMLDVNVLLYDKSGDLHDTTAMFGFDSTRPSLFFIFDGSHYDATDPITVADPFAVLFQ